MRNPIKDLIIGFGLGIAAVLSIGAINTKTPPAPGKYQSTIVYEPDRSRLVFARMNTCTGQLEVWEYPATAFSSRTQIMGLATE